VKNPKPIQSDEALSKTLRQWNVNATLPARFQEGVWQRIARLEAASNPGVFQPFLNWLEATFRRPKLAVSYVMVILLLGLTTGYWQARGKSAQIESQWRAHYVQSVDPYLMPRP
jgi:hypothetical protein